MRWFPKITNREKWESWEAKGAKDMRHRAREEAQRILREHNPQYLTTKQIEEIEKIATDSKA